MKLKAKAVRLLLKVKDHVLEEPKRLRMGEFIRVKAMDADSSYNSDGFGKEGTQACIKYPACDTVGCIGGWCDLLANGMPLNTGDAVERGDEAANTAATLLGFDRYDDDSPAYGLFYMWGWPEAQRNRYNKAATPKTRAKIVGEVIDAFIANPAAFQDGRQDSLDDGY